MKVSQSIVLVLFYFLSGCVVSNEPVPIKNNVDVDNLASQVKKAILDGDTDFINSLLPEGEYLSASDTAYIFGRDQSVRKILLHGGLKVDIEKVEDWTKSGKVFYRVYYIANQNGDMKDLKSMEWMEDYAVCLFEYKSGRWIVPYTFCYSETDWK